jgi:hypothetical protein
VTTLTRLQQKSLTHTPHAFTHARADFELAGFENLS